MGILHVQQVKLQSDVKQGHSDGIKQAAGRDW